MKKTNKYVIREQNEATVLKTIIDHQEISRAEIATMIHLNKASVSSITKALLENQLVQEVGIGDASSVGGRKPILLKFNGQAGLALALDIGYNYITGMLTYLDGTKIHSVSHKQISIAAENIIETIDLIVQELTANKPTTYYGIIGMSLAIHGIVHDNQIRFTPYYNLADFDLVSILEERYDYPVILENEANLTALGEYCFSSTYDNVISISVHSGIGAGIVLNGRLHTGEHGQAGEIGHTIFMPEGKPCPCGNHGCLEQYASNKIMFESFAQEKHLPWANSDLLTQAYKEGDPLAKELLHENTRLLAIGINNLTMLFDPQVIVINSSVYRKAPELVVELQQHLHSSFLTNIHIQTGTLRDLATLYGGVALTTSKFLNIPQLKLR